MEIAATPATYVMVSPEAVALVTAAPLHDEPDETSDAASHMIIALQDSIVSDVLRR